MEQSFLSQMLSGPRIIAVSGHFGSGKTEFSVSLAMALRNRSPEKIALCDLDIENPYFRSRERQGMLLKAGIQVYSDPSNGKNGSELQTISASIRAPLEDPGCRTVLDCGGDHTGAMILNQFHKYFEPDCYQLLFVINQNRPGTDTVDKAVYHIQSIESATGLKVTGLISNSHLIWDTTADVVSDGWHHAEEVSQRTGVPLLCACCMEKVLPDLSGCGFELFPIGMFMRDSYLDKQV